MASRREVRTAWIKYRLTQAGVVGASLVSVVYVMERLGWLGK